MTTRRKFIKTLTMGAVAVSSAGPAKALSAVGAGVSPFSLSDPSSLSCFDKPSNPSSDPAPERNLISQWTYSFHEETSELILQSGSTVIAAHLSFRGGDWTLSRSHDGVANRFALVHPDGNVQGYWVVNTDGGHVEMLFYHRSAQNYDGLVVLDAKVSFAADSFACRTGACRDERVLNLTHGDVDNAFNDSIFAPASDRLLRFEAASLAIQSEGKGAYSVKMSGRIDAAAESVFHIALMDHYMQNRYMPYYKSITSKTAHKVPTGWMSWNTYFDTATAEDNLAEARIGKKYLQPFGCDIWHIESWQGNSDKLPVSGFYNMNLEVNEKQFPKGMKQLASDIRKLGFISGIWTAPFGTGSETFYQAHEGWFLHDKNGKPVSSWNGKYTLDPTVVEARDHIRHIHAVAAHEWGYGYFKVDGMSGRDHGYSAHLYERPEIRACFHDPYCPNPFELCVKAIREGIGEDCYMLACQGHSTGPEATYANASRLGADIVDPNSPVTWNGVRNQARCFLNQAFAHNITMICDPDTLLVRDLPWEQARVSATIIALPGQLTFFGDKLAGLEDGKMKILQQTLPVTNIRPVSLYPYFTMLPVWHLGINNGKMPEYHVVALFNWDDEETLLSTSARELGIADAKMSTYEFWTGKVGCVEEGGMLEAMVPAHGVRVFALHRQTGLPQWIGSDRHITMSAGELSDYRWNGSVLSMNIHLVGGFPLTQHFYIPDGFRLSGLRWGAAKCSQTLHEGHLALTLTNKTTTDILLELQF